MRKMWKRVAGFLLLTVLVCGLLPVAAEAAEPENRFVLVAEAGGRLVIAPEYITYEAGLNIGQALGASDHIFDGLADGQIYAIDGVDGSYTRSDQTGDHLLTKSASEVTHFFISERKVSTPAEPLDAGLLKLMTAMAAQ